MMEKCNLLVITSFVAFVIAVTTTADVVTLKTDSDVDKLLNENLLPQHAEDRGSADACGDCENGGICKKYAGNVYKCKCLEGFYGPKCDNDSCYTQPCKNGGTCQPVGKYFRCTCPSPYSGKKCLDDPCSSNPCKNNGTCQLEGKDYKCDCKLPYYGKTCENDPCSPNPCKNNGTCQVEGKGYKCDCELPYYGMTCENECQCQNGQCKMVDDELKCVCNPEFGLNTKGVCKECNCGKGANCTFDSLWLLGEYVNCICPEGFQAEKEKCVAIITSSTVKTSTLPPSTSTTKSMSTTSTATSTGIQYTSTSRKTAKTTLTTGGSTRGNETFSTEIGTVSHRTSTEAANMTGSEATLNSTIEFTPTVNSTGSEPPSTSEITMVEETNATMIHTTEYANFTDTDLNMTSTISVWNNTDNVTAAETTYMDWSTSHNSTETAPSSIFEFTTVEETNSTLIQTTGYDNFTETDLNITSMTSIWNNTDNVTGIETTYNDLSTTLNSTETALSSKYEFTTLEETNATFIQTTEYVNFTESDLNMTSTTSISNNTSNMTDIETTQNDLSTPFNGTETAPSSEFQFTSVEETNATLNQTTEYANFTEPDLNVTNTITTPSWNNTDNGTDVETTYTSTSITTNMTETTSPSTYKFVTDEEISISTVPTNHTTEYVSTTERISTSVKDVSKETITTSEPSSSTVNPDEKVCEDNPCKNGGTCVATDGQAVCHCPYLYGGKICSESAWCADGPGKDLCPAGSCVFNFTSKVGHCECQTDQYYDYNLRSCKLVDKCPLMAGMCSANHEICLNNACECKKHFKKVDGKCVPNFCESEKKPCAEDELCEDIEDEPGHVKCSCKEGYIFNGNSCDKANKCDLPGAMPCQQICNEVTGSCECRQGFTLQSDKKTCKLADGNSKCQKNCGVGTCIKYKSTEICVCPRTHYSFGSSCVDLCTAKQVPAGLCPDNLCLPDQTLGFRCKCEGKFAYHKNNVTCLKKLVCSEGNGTEICGAKLASCVEDFETKEGFRCECELDSEMDTDGVCKKKCELKKYQDRCAQKLGFCDMDGYEVKCKCPPMTTFGEDDKCTELARSSYIGTLPLERKIYVTAKQYSVQQGKNVNEVIELDEIRRDLKDSMQLLYGENYKFADVLACNGSSESLVCKVEVQFNSDPKDQIHLIADPNICLSNGSDTCFIPPELVLRKKDITQADFVKTDPCMEEVKNINCGKATVCSSLEEGNFLCSCAQGFSSYNFYNPYSDPKTIIHNCQDINECLLPKACPNRTRCLNTYGSYECLCLNGYRPNGTNVKEVGCAEICDEKACMHGKCEISGDLFSCKCDKGYSGSKCEDTVSNTVENSSMKIALIVLSTTVIPMILFSAFMIHKYRILQKIVKRSNYLDDSSSLVSLEPIRNDHENSFEGR